MGKSIEVNIKCPTCETILTTIDIRDDVKGIFKHKCNRCKRYWKMDYGKNNVLWIKGKEDSTFIKNYKLNLLNGTCLPI